MPTEPRRERLRRALSAPSAQPAAPLAHEAGARRDAAVSVVIHEAVGVASVLLIQRAERATDPWSGHMALPGGRADPVDADLRATAERETLEEVGLHLGSAELLGTLSDRSPARSSGLTIRPFVYWLTTQPELVLNEEVTSALWVPLDPLAQGKLETEHEFRGVRFPAWSVEGKMVWGFTYRVLEELLAVLSR